MPTRSMASRFSLKSGRVFKTPSGRGFEIDTLFQAHRITMALHFMLERVPAILAFVAESVVIGIEAVDVVDLAKLDTEPPVHRFGIGNSHEDAPARLQKRLEALQKHARIIHMLENEAHNDDVEPLVGFKFLEIGEDDFTLEVRAFRLELIDGRIASLR